MAGQRRTIIIPWIGAVGADEPPGPDEEDLDEFGRPFDDDAEIEVDEDDGEEEDEE